MGVTEEMRVRPRETPRWTLTELAAELDAVATAEAIVTGISLNTKHLEQGDLYAALPGRHRTVPRSPASPRPSEPGVLTDPEGAAIVTELPEIIVDDPAARAGQAQQLIYGTHERSRRSASPARRQDHHDLPRRGGAGRPCPRWSARSAPDRQDPGASTLTTPEAPQLQALFAVMREEAVELCAMEVSSHALVQGRVDGFVFDVAVFLNLGRDHLDFHKDLEDYFLAKASLFTPEHAKHAVINIDDVHGNRLRELTPLPVTTFSTDGNAADWRAVNIRPDRLGTDLEVLGPDGVEFPLSVPLPGVFNVSNALAVIAALAQAGLRPRRARRRYRDQHRRARPYGALEQASRSPRSSTTPTSPMPSPPSSRRSVRHRWPAHHGDRRRGRPRPWQATADGRGRCQATPTS